MSPCAFKHKRPFGHDKGEVGAEVNVRTTDGSNIVNLVPQPLKEVLNML